MASFFKKYPKIIYNGKVVTDIIARTAIREKYSNKLIVYYPYDLQEGDTPEIIAHKYYGDVEKHWLVLLANSIMDPFFDFTLSYSEFDNYITNKYKDYANSLNLWDTSTWTGIWQSNYQYSANDSVCFGNTAYICANSHVSSTFSTDYKSYWTTIKDGNFWKDNWQNDVYYNENDVVKYNSTLYVCKQTHTSNSSNSLIVSNADYWKTYSNALEFSKVTTNIQPPGYRAIITTTDSISGESTEHKFFIDKNSYFDKNLDDTFNYADMILNSDTVTYKQSKELLSIYDYESELNEKKRTIKLIRKEYASQLEKELKILMEKQYG